MSEPSAYPYAASSPPYAPLPPTNDPTAVMGRRVGAAIVDSIIITIPALLLWSNQFEYLKEANLSQSGSDFCDAYYNQHTTAFCADVGDRVYFSDEAPVAPWLLGLGLSLLVYVVVQGLRGWTPGKALFGIRTVKDDGQAPGIGKAIIRWLLLIVDGLCLGLVGFIVALTNKGHRRVGDMAATTYVVRKDAVGQPIVVPGITPVYAGSYPPPTGAGPGAWGAPPPGAASGSPPGAAPTPWGTEAPSTYPPRRAAPSGPPTTDSRSEPPGAGVSGWTAPGGAAPEGATPAGATPEEEAGAGARREAAAGSGATEAGATDSTAAAADASQGAYNPQWDPARGTYIVWSPERGHWLGWDDAAKEWKPL